MAELLKERYNVAFIRGLAERLHACHPSFPMLDFETLVFADRWADMALKARMRRITTALYQTLPSDYGDALAILSRVAPEYSGFEPMFFPDYVELYGIGDWERSIPALEHFTKYSSSEFAVRPFIIRHQTRMMQQMRDWAESKNEHVRRLASEGCRPRLPWAMALPAFKTDPAPVLPILKRLRADDSEYVRRSVANNLNDISKDNPDIVIDIARQWLGQSVGTDRLVKHACRTLLKAGNPDVLKLFGFHEPGGVSVNALTVQPETIIGGDLRFEFELVSTTDNLGPLRIEYAVEFVRANGSRSSKVFKIGEGVYSAPSKQVRRTHSFKRISTRRYYPGCHRLRVIINGNVLATADFQLTD